MAADERRQPTPRTQIPFADLPGWDVGEADALISGVARHLSKPIRSRPRQAPFLAAIADSWPASVAAPRAFVEARFSAFRVDAPGFFTGYYEPMIPARRTPDAGHTVPLYKRPADLVRVDPPDPRLPGDGTFARAMPGGERVAYHDRPAIMAGALAGRGLELAFVSDKVDAFFAQVQGSARLVFADGTTQRIGYDGKTGHPYTAIGRVMIDRGLLPEGGATMQTIRAALKANPDDVDAILSSNRSFAFFREKPSHGEAFGPVAAGGVPLLPFRSLAVDWSHIALGTPVYVETVVPGRGPLSAAMVAEDTGSAIVGPARGDIFMGSGDAAGEMAGAMKAAGRLTMILPNEP